MNQKTQEALELLSRCTEEQKRRAFTYILLLAYMGKHSNPEAEQINAEYQAELAAGTIAEEKHDAYLSSLADALHVF